MRPRDKNITTELNDEACSLCSDLLQQMQRFFDMLQDAHYIRETDWLTVEDIANELRISKNVVYRLIRNGELEAVNVVDSKGHIPQRGHYRIKRSCLEKYLESKKTVSPPKPTSSRCRSREIFKVKNHLGL